MDNVPDLRFPKFTTQWKNYNLGELLKITSASRVHKNEWTESGVPFFRSSDVVANYKGFNNKKAYISLELFRKLSDKCGCVKKDDLLITGGGSIGIPYLVKTNEPLYFKDADLLWLKNSDQINGYFLYTFFITMLFRKHLTRITHTGTISHYTIEQAKSTPIKLPEPKEQQKIADFLSSVDNKISLLTEKQSLLQRYKKGVMQKLFSQELRFQDDQGNDFPDWEEKKFGDLGTFLGGGTPSTDEKEYWTGDVPWVSSSDTTENSIHKISYTRLITDKAIKDSATKLIPAKSLLLVSRVGVGKMAVTLCEVCTSQDFTNFTPVENDVFFIAYYLSYHKNKLISFSQGTSIKGFTIKDIKLLKLNMPPFLEQEKIANFLSEIDKKLEAVSKKIEQSQSFKKGLLQQMFV